VKRIGILVLIYLVGVVSGAVLHSMTSGAVDRARIVALDSQLKERNDKLSEQQRDYEEQSDCHCSSPS
jgi:uncharacterized membrane-anchored protein YhcB (DUF1043 family)